MTPLSRQILRGIAAVGTVVLVAGLVSPSGAADRPVPPPPGGVPSAAEMARAGVTSSYVSVSGAATSSKGKRLRVGFSASHYSFADNFSFRLGLPSGLESHSWYFTPDTGGYDVNGDGKGKLTMDTSATADFAKLNVKVIPTGKFKAYKCGGKVSSKYRPIKIKGVYYNDSKSSKWGHVGSMSKTSFVLKGTFSKSYGVSCPSGGNPSCLSLMSWSTSQSTGTGYESISGYARGSKAYASGSRSTDIPASNDGQQYDYVTDPKVTKPKLKVKPDDFATLDVWAGPGSAVLTSSTAKDSDTTNCGKGKKQVRAGWSGTITNGSKPLKLTMQAAPPITIDDSSFASFTKYSVKN